MSSAALHSHQVNYLIYRYLQEFGHENAAIAFYRDWHRPAEHRDPETFPFAQSVRRNELVSVIQDGLHHDELLARVRKSERRFRWTDLDARDSVERQEGAMENGTATRPRASTNKRRGRPLPMLPPDDFPTPVPKRQRRSDGNETHVNGDRDAMDVDAPSPSADAEDDGDMASPALVSEPEPTEVGERYDSMDVATQTDVKTAPKTSTMQWKIDKPGATVLHGIWNPNSDLKNSETLLVVGESLCRFYHVAKSLDTVDQISYVDEPSLPHDAVVTASTWRPDGRAASSAVDDLRQLPNGNTISSQLLLEHSRNSGSTVLQPGPSALEPVALVLCLRYSPDAEYLLVLRTNLKRALVQIWKASRLDSETSFVPSEPIAWRYFEREVLDAAWIGNDMFIVCGDDGLSLSYQIDTTHIQENGEVSTASFLQHGLKELPSGQKGENCKWDKLQFDQNNEVIVLASTESRKLVSIPKAYITEGKEETSNILELPGQLTAVSFQPRLHQETGQDPVADLEKPSLLAAAFEDGVCLVYEVRRAEERAVRCSEVVSINLPDGPALALAWSANGQHLAVGNTFLVSIWHVDSLKRKNGILHNAEPLLTWRPPAPWNDFSNEEEMEEETQILEPSLSWSADSEAFAFAVDKQIAVVRFRPPLQDRDQQTEMNGTLTP